MRPRYEILYVLHIMPEEVFDAQRIISAFEVAAMNNPNVKTTLYLDLNVSDEYYDWDKSDIPRDFFLKFFDNVRSHSIRNLNIIYYHRDKGHWGVNSTRRNVIREYAQQYDYIGFIDCDIYFDPLSIDYVYQSLEKIEGEYVIFSGLLPKMWIKHFDPLVHPNFKSVKDKDFMFRINPNTVFGFYKKQKFEIQQTEDIAIGGGWFNLFSTTIFDYVDIPDDLGPYGIDDHWIQECCKFLSKNGWDIKQYTNRKFLILENHGRRFHFDENLINKKIKKYSYEKTAKMKYEELFEEYKQNTYKKYFT